VITFNGEIYNYRELRQKLEGRGRIFRTSSDTEVLLALYEAEGERCVDSLVGMFAFAIWDSRRRRLFCARDRLGQKPFYYAAHEEGFSFSSEIGPLLLDPDIHCTLDSTAIHHYLSLHYVPAPRTGFEQIRKLPPAHFLTVEHGSVTVQRYWRPSFEPKSSASTDALAEEAWHLIKEATRSQLVSDVPVGAFLSGGHDSTAVLAAMRQATSGTIKAFTVGFSEAKFDELRSAEASARHFGCEFFSRLIAPKDVEILPRIVARHGEPFADPSSIPTYYLSELARQHVTVALSGDGGDEAFGGYSRYVWAWYASRLDKLPPLALHGIERLVWGLAEAPFAPPALQRGAHYATRLFSLEYDRYLSLGCHFTPQARWDLYTNDFRETIQGPDTWAGYAESAQQSDAVAGLDRYVQIDLDGYLSAGILAKVDIASMMHSLEVRSPFLDHRLFEFAARLPAHLKQNGHKSRTLYKQAIREHVPAAVLRRPKQGLTLPVHEWLRDGLAHVLEDLVLGGRFAQRGHFRQEHVAQMYRDHRSGRADHGYALWNLIALELWMRQFLDGVPADSARDFRMWGPNDGPDCAETA
jgi:asparagine synthase (glutamine-hydrolysing)